MANPTKLRDNLVKAEQEVISTKATRDICERNRDNNVGKLQKSLAAAKENLKLLRKSHRTSKVPVKTAKEDIAEARAAVIHLKDRIAAFRRQANESAKTHAKAVRRRDSLKSRISRLERKH